MKGVQNRVVRERSEKTNDVLFSTIYELSIHDVRKCPDFHS